MTPSSSRLEFPLRVAHLSDVHFGRISELRVVEAVLDEVNRADMDLVVVSGDLTQRARRRQFQDARAFLDRFSAPTLVVPGNHDVPQWYRPLQRAARPLKKYARYIASELRPRRTLPGLAAFGLNSAHGWTIKGGRIRTGDLSAMRAFFDSRPATAFRVLVLHHHLLHLAELGEHDVSRGAREALEAIRACNVDLILCGHLHISHVTHVEVVAGEGPRLVIASAGTATSSRSREEGGRNANFYNWVRVWEDAFEIEERQFDPGEGQFKTVRETGFVRQRPTTDRSP